MNKNYFLVGAVCLLAGCVIGFIFANSLNRNAANNTSETAANSNTAISPNHPALDANRMPQADVQAAIDLAKNEPENFEAQTQAAALFYQIERFEQAIEFLKKANQLKPEDYGTKVNLGNAYFEAGQYEEAEKWYSAALAANADDVNVRTDLGLTFLLRQPPNLDRAVKEFTRSLEKDPNHAPTLQNLTIAHTKKGDAAKAKQTLARLESVSADNPAITKLRDDIQKSESK